MTHWKQINLKLESRQQVNSGKWIWKYNLVSPSLNVSEMGHRQYEHTTNYTNMNMPQTIQIQIIQWCISLIDLKHIYTKLLNIP